MNMYWTHHLPLISVVLASFIESTQPLEKVLSEAKSKSSRSNVWGGGWSKTADLEKAELHKYFNFILNKKYLFKILIRFSRGSQEQNL
jgi:hypothetical protein